ncbi:uncharacterized protein LOC101899810 [Musca domestica]|uniref:Uncharacterized protein LOC101899810 n=1 Tax=Musca domestica TaxID=7370 RepID=A0ABM3UM77_MUSDO|nr:uncharacterized protein LOC101899810 [Musca domestica]
MNCVAIPPSDEKRNAAGGASVSSATAALAVTPLHIIHSEVTLTSPLPIEHSSALLGHQGSPSALTNKSQSLQRTTTTHLYCRSLEKDATALAVPHGQRRSSNSRGFASCLRGERDDAFLDYQQRAIQYDMAAAAQAAAQCRAAQQQGNGSSSHCYQQQQQQDYIMDENHPVQVLQTSMCSAGSGGSNFDTTTGRSEYKSKTLPRIHFDNSINDMSLNEGKYFETAPDIWEENSPGNICFS